MLFLYRDRIKTVSVQDVQRGGSGLPEAVEPNRRLFCPHGETGSRRDPRDALTWRL